jgi:transcriptional regulator
MRPNPKHEVTDRAVVRDLIAENPWATIVSHNGEELVASHYPVLLDDRAADDELTIVTHVGRPDERVHDLGASEVLLIVAGLTATFHRAGTARR